MASIIKVDDVQDAAGNNIINEAADVITIGASGDTINIASGATNNIGITEVDQWYLTSDKTDNSDITANLARVAQSGFGRLGTGMTESSGIFSFPSTGIWRVEFCGAWQVAAGDNASVETYLTLNDSSYAAIAHAGVSNKAASGTAAGVDNGYVASLIDVTDVANVKVKFTTASMATNTQLNGAADPLGTNFIFTRLGDT